MTLHFLLNLLLTILFLEVHMCEFFASFWQRNCQFSVSFVVDKLTLFAVHFKLTKKFALQNCKAGFQTVY